MLIAAPVAWLFGPSLVGEEMFAFRDGAHYYYPYYHFVAGQWGEGRVPLWNPQENLGQPLLADATAAVFYPGKLIFASPLEYNANYKLYVVGHVLLAALAAYAAARGVGRSLPAAVVCALSYAFSGSVLFQYCNIVYLVGAAWLPLAVLAAHRALDRRSYVWAAALGVVLAMMVLGGDPQTAYHAMLMAALYALVLVRLKGWGRHRSKPAATRTVTEKFLRLGRAPIPLLVVAGLIAFALAAVQILPGAQSSRRSTRAAYDVPRNVYELAACGLATSAGEAPGKASLAFLCGRTAPGHHTESYEFSVAPWHAASYLWPNCYGSVFPVNTRWIRALPSEGRTWTPTLYMGLLPLLLALSQFRFRERHRQRRPGPTSDEVRPRKSAAEARSAAGQDEPPNGQTALLVWLSWTVVLALLAALGWYSIGWLLQEVHHAFFGPDARPLPVGWPFGGVYWLLQTWLPGYVYFRFPAKWLTVAAAAWSLLCGCGWDAMAERRRFLLRALSALAAGSVLVLLLAVALIFATPAWHLLASVVPNDATFGLFDAEAARAGIFSGLTHSSLVAGAAWCLLRGGKRNAWLLVLVAVDLAIAQRSLIATVPARAGRQRPAVAQTSHRAADRLADRATRSTCGQPNRPAVPLRCFRPFVAPPPCWAESSSPDRPARVQAWEQATLFPKYQLLTQIELVDSSSALKSLDHRAVLEALRAEKLWGAIGTQAYVLPHQQLGDEPCLRRIHNAAPRAWIVHHVEVLPPLEEKTPAAVRERTRAVFSGGETRNLNETAVVETDRPLPLADGNPPPGAAGAPGGSAHSRCSIVRYRPDAVVIEARLDRPGLLVLADTFAPGWQCEVTDRASGRMRRRPILRTNRVLRGVWLPAGRHRVAFDYRPAAFRCGAILSGIGWSGLLLGGVGAGLLRGLFCGLLRGPFRPRRGRLR